MYASTRRAATLKLSILTAYMSRLTPFDPQSASISLFQFNISSLIVLTIPATCCSFIRVPPLNTHRICSSLSSENFCSSFPKISKIFEKMEEYQEKVLRVLAACPMESLTDVQEALRRTNGLVIRAINLLNMARCSAAPTKSSTFSMSAESADVPQRIVRRQFCTWKWAYCHHKAWYESSFV